VAKRPYAVKPAWDNVHPTGTIIGHTLAEICLPRLPRRAIAAVVVRSRGEGACKGGVKASVTLCDRSAAGHSRSPFGSCCIVWLSAQVFASRPGQCFRILTGGGRSNRVPHARNPWHNSPPSLRPGGNKSCPSRQPVGLFCRFLGRPRPPPRPPPLCPRRSPRRPQRARPLLPKSPACRPSNTPRLPSRRSAKQKSLARRR